MKELTICKTIHTDISKRYRGILTLQRNQLALCFVGHHSGTLKPVSKEFTCAFFGCWTSREESTVAERGMSLTTIQPPGDFQSWLIIPGNLVEDGSVFPGEISGWVDELRTIKGSSIIKASGAYVEMCSQPGSYSLHSDSELYFTQGDNRIGGKYWKAQYMEYVDATFTRRKRLSEAEAHLGILGRIKPSVMF